MTFGWQLKVLFPRLGPVTLGVRELSHVWSVCSPHGTDGFSVTVTIFEEQNSFSTLEKGRNVRSSTQVVQDKVFYHFSAVAVFFRQEKWDLLWFKNKHLSGQHFPAKPDKGQ